ncbi:hypothetical protein DSUL_140040 [Desulfovibrionales bacterium]
MLSNKADQVNLLASRTAHGSHLTIQTATKLKTSIYQNRPHTLFTAITQFDL